jgi:hypothetical protein
MLKGFFYPSEKVSEKSEKQSFFLPYKNKIHFETLKSIPYNLAGDKFGFLVYSTCWMYKVFIATDREYELLRIQLCALNLGYTIGRSFSTT